MHRNEWARQKIVIEMNAGHEPAFGEPDGPSVTFYHGTTALVADLLMRSGGFIPGENGHTKGKTHFKGCFGSKFFDVAKCRGDQTRNMNEDMIYTFANCPIVLEVRANMALLRTYKRKRPDLVVVPGMPGLALPGLSVVAVHWNMRMVRNYMRFHLPEARLEVTRRGGVFECCCGLGRQRLDFQSCGDFCTEQFVKYGKFRVCQRCIELWR
jgi:hypothetical protein